MIEGYQKICITCKRQRPSNFFHIRKSAPDGLSSECKECVSKRNKLYKLAHRKEITEHKKQVRKAQREKFDRGEIVGPLSKICLDCHVEKVCTAFPIDKISSDGLSLRCKECTKVRAHVQYIKHQERVKKAVRLWAANNKDKVHEHSVQYFQKNKKLFAKKRREKKRTDPNFRLMLALRDRQRKALLGKAKVGTFFERMGCSPEIANLFLESQFYVNSRTGEKMGWANYGYLSGEYGWDYEHIIPICCFDFNDPVQQKQAFHISNLQPMWHTDHVEKHSKWGDNAPEGVTLESLMAKYLKWKESYDKSNG